MFVAAELLFVTCSTNIKVEGRRACEWKGRGGEERGGRGRGGEEREGNERRK